MKSTNHKHTQRPGVAAECNFASEMIGTNVAASLRSHQRSEGRIGTVVGLVLFCSILNACSTDTPVIPDPLITRRADAVKSDVKPAGSLLKLSTEIADTPRPPETAKSSTIKPEPPVEAAAQPEKADITVAFDQMSLPNFIQAIYGVVLKKNYTVDPQIASRKDLVTFHAGELQTSKQIEAASRLLLKSYGVAVLDTGTGFYRILPDNAQTGYSPEIRRGRALPDVPLPMRPVFHLVELEAVRLAEVSGWIRTMFGTKVTINEDSSRNALLLSGPKDDVAAALEAVQILDKPLMKGKRSFRINPVFWSAEELSKRLAEILQTEGYTASTGGGIASPITLLPVQAINAIIVFASDASIAEHVVSWAKELDKSNNEGGSGGYFTYQARNTNANDLAKVLQEVLTSSPIKGATNKVVINPANNTLIMQGSSGSYAQITNLLQELDKPTKSALIEVTVAEVTLDNTTQLGVEWAFNASGANGATIVGGTRPGISLGNGGTTTGLAVGTGGLTIARLNSVGDLRAMLNMLATSTKANVLSTPRILARNNEVATIQVGSEIPTINMQQTNAATGGAGVIQSVQYRNTGIILKVKPTIYSGDRIDLDITQEVSSSTSVGVASSPVIDTRKVDTHLSLKDGVPILLGGLITNNNSRADSGVPLLKDIPGLGQVFRTNTDNNHKTELIILITPYIVADDYDAQSITDAFRSRLGEWAQSKTVNEEKVPEKLSPKPKP